MTVANLAVCLAESGHTVLVLDSDLRAPQAHKLFGVQVEPGLSDVLSGSPDAPSLADVAQETKVPGVQVIAAGPGSPTPAGCSPGPPTSCVRPATWPTSSSSTRPPR